MDNKEFRNEIRRIINDRITMVAEELHEKGRRWADMFTEEDNRAIETYTIDSVGESEQEAAEWEEKRREKDRKRLKKAETGIHSNKSLENESAATPKSSKSSSVEKAEVIPEDPVPQENCSELSTLNSSTSASMSNIEAAPSESNLQLQENFDRSDGPDRQIDDKDNVGVNVPISGEESLQCKKDPVSVPGSRRNESFEQGPQRRPAQDRHRKYRQKSSWSVRRINWRESRYSNTSNEAYSYTSHQGSRQQGLEWRPNGTGMDSQMHKNRDWSSHRMNWRSRPNPGFDDEHNNRYQFAGNWRRHLSLGFNEERYNRSSREFPVGSNYLHSYESTNRHWWGRTRERRYRRY